MSYGLEERFPEEIQAVGFEGILFCKKPSKIVRFITLPLENLEKNKALTMQIQRLIEIQYDVFLIKPEHIFSQLEFPQLFFFFKYS